MSQRVTQTFTLTLTVDPNELGNPHDALVEALENHTDEEHYELEIISASEAKKTSTLTQAQKAKLLELKGWVYGEHLKQQAGLPSEWNQSNWLTGTACGTACCVAGKVALDAGAVPADWSTGRPIELEVDAPATTIMIDGAKREVEEFAREELGLSEAEASNLFNGYNNYQKIADVIDELVSA